MTQTTVIIKYIHLKCSDFVAGSNPTVILSVIIGTIIVTSPAPAVQKSLATVRRFPRR